MPHRVLHRCVHSATICSLPCPSPAATCLAGKPSARQMRVKALAHSPQRPERVSRSYGGGREKEGYGEERMVDTADNLEQGVSLQNSTTQGKRTTRGR